MVRFGEFGQKHLHHIGEAIKELHQFQARTAHPAPIAYQYVGTIVDNTVSLLCCPANALDDGGRQVFLTEQSNWVQLMAAVHRSFFSSIHSATEKALTELCTARGLALESNYQRSFLELLDQIDGASELKEVRAATIKLRGKVRSAKPGFDDVLNVALATSEVSEDKKKMWRKYFNALGVVRNKFSHSDVTLTEADRQKLREGGFATAISPSGELGVNTRMYAQITTHILEFFASIGIK
jgi:hypothetical protein